MNMYQNQNQNPQTLPPLIPNTNLPPEQKYEIQLRQMDQMGFTDKEANINALINAKGNVERALSLLLEM